VVADTRFDKMHLIGLSKLAKFLAAGAIDRVLGSRAR
jgi:hypothetical protein